MATTRRPNGSSISPSVRTPSGRVKNAPGGLGFIHTEDTRDRNFPMRAALPAEQLYAMLPQYRYWPMFKKVLNQGFEGTCVGHGVKHFMMAAPIIQTTPFASPTAINIYDTAIKHDEWTENDNDAADGHRTFGTSVRAGMKVIQDLGYIQEYLWAEHVEEVFAWVRGFGSCVLGCAWYDGMFNTDARGLIHPTGQIAGGHCVCINYINIKKNVIGGPNSWGPEWGVKGAWRMQIDEFRTLFAHPWTEVACALEIRLVTPATVTA